MQLFNDTVFKLGYLVGQLQYPAYSLSLVVKGTFRLLPGRPALPVPEQLEFAGDEPLEDDKPLDLRYPMDLVHYKPRADVLLVGKCHPGPQPARNCRVTFEVDGRAKSLAVIGDRHWTRDHLPSAPEPFRELDLTYERSFGGAAFAYNPIGRGYEVEPFSGATPLPNLENAARLIRQRGEQQLPAGFGPLRRNWKPRSDKVGTYDKAWRKTRWPWFPSDFDFGHMNVAPEDQQRSYLRGDERLRFEHLHPTEVEFVSALPGFRLRCFVRKDASAVVENEARELREVTMNLDTLWVDMETQTLVLTWRGVAPLATPDAEEEIGEILIAAEPLAEPAIHASRYAARLATLLAEGAAEPEPEPEPEPDAAPVDATVEAALAAAEASVRASMIEAGLDPDAAPVVDAKAQAEHLAELGIVLEEPDDEPVFTRERVAAFLAEKQSLADRDLAELDLSGLDLSGADLGAADLHGANLANCKLVRAKLTGALLVGAKLDAADLTEASLAGADLSAASLLGAKLVRADLSGALAEQALFRGADLREVNAKQLSAPEADFSAARAEGAELSEANLARAKLAQTNLRNARLVAATLEGANGEGADFSAADLTELRAAQGAAFVRAVFVGVRAERAVFEGADLRGADFSLAVLSNASFNRAKLDAAVLYGAQLKQAKFMRASLTGANLSRANLFEATFERADLSHSDLRDASMFAAETWNAVFGGSSLLGADVNMTKLAPEEPEPEA